ncbi:unnamed protein product, partial [Didymodactylos carnosus]
GWGEPITPKELVKIATSYAKELGKYKTFKKGQPTMEWYYTFMKRHPQLTTAKSISFELPRAKIAQTIVDKWFNLLEKVLIDNDLFDKPSQIFNCDESGFADETERRNNILN